MTWHTLSWGGRKLALAKSGKIVGVFQSVKLARVLAIWLNRWNHTLPELDDLLGDEVEDNEDNQEEEKS